MTAVTPPRNYALDILRVVACYMVIQIHTGEFYYIGNVGQVLNTHAAHVIGWYNSLCRTCVPLFVMISGFFLFPVGDIGTFFRKRISRVAIPFVFWCIIYALYYYFRGSANMHSTLLSILQIPVNYGVEIGHLWFVYMLLGLYLFAPVISPWVQTASRRGMEFYLALWLLAFSLPYIHLVFPQIWGEAFWNHTPMLYYFSGFMGYAVLASYIRRFHLQPRLWNLPVGIALIVAGYVITAYGFLHRLHTEKFVNTLELTWSFETINIAMMTCGIFLLVKNIRIRQATSPIMRLVIDISSESYGIYLAHIIVLNAYHSLLNQRIGVIEIKIPVLAVCTFITTYLIMKILSFLPESKWLVG